MKIKKRGHSPLVPDSGENKKPAAPTTGFEIIGLDVKVIPGS
jgi:hypothetical protein